MDNLNTNLSETEEPSTWRTIGVYFIDTLLLPLLAATTIYAGWLILGFPDFSYLWLILFVFSYLLISIVLKNSWGTTIGRKIFKCSPSEEKTRKVSTWIVWLCLLFWGATKLFLPSSSVKANQIENDYYQISLPSGWKADFINDTEPLFSCIAVGKNPNECAMFFTVNYNTTGISLEEMVNMTLGNMERANVPDLSVAPTTFHGLSAQRISGTIQGSKFSFIAFYTKSGVFSYVLSQNLSDSEFEKIIKEAQIKDTKPTFVDFEKVWRNFMGDTNEWNVYQPMEDGFILEGCNYDRNKGEITIKISVDASENDIRTYFQQMENHQMFLDGIKINLVMVPLANNYGKNINIIFKDSNGNIAYSIPSVY